MDFDQNLLQKPRDIDPIIDVTDLQFVRHGPLNQQARSTVRE